MCKTFSNHINIAQCSTVSDELSCNSPICMGCALEFYEFLCEQEESSPITECGFCRHSLTIEREEDPTGLSFDKSGMSTLTRASKFSNIQELDEENETESDIGDLDLKKPSPMKLEDVKINLDNEAPATPSDLTFKLAPVKKTCLDNLIIRDATSDESA